MSGVRYIDDGNGCVEGVPDDYEPPDACPCCGGPGIFLGTLGRLDQYRCRLCGWVFGVRA